MNSIRRQLTIQLLSGFALLWIGAGTAVYLSVRSGLIKSVDAKMAEDSRIMRFVNRDSDDSIGGPRGRGRSGSRGLSARHPAFYDTNGGSFYQIWTGLGESVRRSPSLGTNDLPFPVADAAKFGTGTLTDGKRVRTMRQTSISGSRGRGKKGKSDNPNDSLVYVIAQDLEPIDEILVKVLGGILVVGAVGAMATVLLVGGSLVRGLRPLDELGQQSESLDISAEQAAFDASGAPLELQPVYARLNDLIRRIQHSFERERRFSSDLAHEMRTPIAELKMMNEIALKYDDQAGEKTHQESLDIAKNLEAMVTNLLALARWENGEIELKEEAIDLEPFVTDCWTPFAQTARQRCMSTNFEFDGSPQVKSDPAMLRHVIGNLLANASEYCPENGTVSLRVDEHRFELSNPAPQLTAEDVEKMCDRYWRGDSARSGTNHAGLGLSLVKSCSQALGIELQIAKRADKLCFTLTFGGGD